MLSTTSTILALVATLVGSAKVPDAVAARASGALVDAEAALRAEGLDGEKLEVWSRRLWGWAYWESGWHASPAGSNDNGAACGVLQVHGPERLLEGATCAAVRKDRVLGFRAGYRMLVELVDKCGSVERALGAYATGQCGGAPMLVRRRCKALGDTCK